MKKLNFGKNKGKALKDCKRSYIVWIAQHEKCLHPDNRWASKMAREILENPEPTLLAQVLLEKINNTHRNIILARYEYKRKEFQAQLENSLAFMESEYGHKLTVKHNEYIFEQRA